MADEQERKRFRRDLAAVFEHVPASARDKLWQHHSTYASDLGWPYGGGFSGRHHGSFYVVTAVLYDTEEGDVCFFERGPEDDRLYFRGRLFVPADRDDLIEPTDD